MAKINEDNRGLFVELTKPTLSQLGAPKQTSYLTINPNYFRGHHYHKDTIEAFILLDGDCNLIIMNKNKNMGSEVHMKQFEFYEVLPGQEHTLISRKGAKLLVYSSKCFDPNNPDTFIYEDPSNGSNT